MNMTEYRGFIILVNANRTYKFDGKTYLRFYEVCSVIDAIMSGEYK